MSAIAIPATCCCGSIGRKDLRQCPDHFRIWNGDQRLTSVGSIIRLCYPQAVCRECEAVGYNHKPMCSIGQKIANARERGNEVDRLFAGYVNGTLTRIPAGTRRDAKDLFLKLVKWYDRQKFRKVSAQVLLGSEDYGGIADLVVDDGDDKYPRAMPYDLKATYNVEDSAVMQVAGYAVLHAGPMYCHGGRILHVTERYAEPQVVDVTERDVRDWKELLGTWRMLVRRGAFKQPELEEEC